MLCTGALPLVAAVQPWLEEMGIQVIPKPFDIDVFLQAVAYALASGVEEGLGMPRGVSPNGQNASHGMSHERRSGE